MSCGINDGRDVSSSLIPEESGEADADVKGGVPRKITSELR